MKMTQMLPFRKDKYANFAFLIIFMQHRPEEVPSEAKMLRKPTTRHFVNLVQVGSEYPHENDSNATI